MTCAKLIAELGDDSACANETGTWFHEFVIMYSSVYISHPYETHQASIW